MMRTKPRDKEVTCTWTLDVGTNAQSAQNLHLSLGLLMQQSNSYGIYVLLVSNHLPSDLTVRKDAPKIVPMDRFRQVDMESPKALSDSDGSYVRRASVYGSDEEPDDKAYGAMLSSDEGEGHPDADELSDDQSSLCRHCSGLVTYANSHPFTLTRYDTKKLLKFSSFQPSSCELCRIFHDALIQIHGHKDLSDWKFRFTLQPGAGFSLAARRFEDVEDTWASDRSGCNLEFYCPHG